MLAFRILGTIFVGISVFTGILKNFGALDTTDETSFIVNCLVSVWSVCWRTFVIVALWLI